MADYFETGANAAAPAAPATNGDASMDDEIMVRLTRKLDTDAY